jgi:hypothetical protein
MSRITGVVVALATTAAVLTGSTSGAAPPAAPAAPSAGLPREIPGGQEVTLADGDLLRVWTSDHDRVVWAKRRDAATGTWGPRTEVLRRRNLFCGDVDVRTASGAVAVLAQCDRYGYAEDQAPTGSRAIWSPDTVTWTSYPLEGEAYEEPGISPDGRRAVWPDAPGYVTWGPEGFTSHTLETPGQEYTATATITDTGQVSYLYGSGLARRCRIVVLTRTGDAPPTRQDLTLANGCSDSAFANVDSDTAWFGDPTRVADRAVISRLDATSPWAVTEIAPAYAPGLVEVEGRLHTDFVTAPGLPLYAIASRDRHVVRAQAYDRTAQAWGSPVVVHDAGTRLCRWGPSSFAEPLGVVLADLTCGGRRVVLTTRDGATWQALRGGTQPIGPSPDGAYVAVPGRSRTHVVSPELGVVTLPGGVTGRCDVVVPDGPSGAVLLTAAGRHRGWPTVLQHSAPDGWARLSRTSLPTPDEGCSEAQASTYDLPYRFDVLGRRNAGYTVRIVRRDAEWKVLRSRR